MAQPGLEELQTPSRENNSALELASSDLPVWHNKRVSLDAVSLLSKPIAHNPKRRQV
jgi:hypothetical protein